MIQCLSSTIDLARVGGGKGEKLFRHPDVTPSMFDALRMAMTVTATIAKQGPSVSRL